MADHSTNKNSKSKKWTCISNCGACCRLAPLERVQAIEALDEKQLELYASMVGSDGWCRFYDTGSRKCRIYNERPDFCDVRTLSILFGIEEQNLNSFSISWVLPILFSISENIF